VSKSANVELARRFHEAFNARDVDAIEEIMHPEVAYIPIMARLEGAEYRGHSEFRRWLAELDDDWIEFRTEPEEFRDLGNDRVITFGTWHARARTSGVVLAGHPATWLTHFEDGKVTRHETFTDRDAALRAAGL
jgi:ketosteroid isomerase-like protein